MDIANMMLEVLDDPQGSRIIAYTKCPLIGEDNEEYVYFMIDRGHPESFEGAGDGETYDVWHTYDNCGNVQVFSSHEALINFFEDNESIFSKVYIEGF